ncbi:MAG: RNA polymerase sigma factor, partial [Chloroflexota bacterium]
MALVNIRVLEGRSGVRHDDDAEERLASLMREYGTSLFNFLLVLTRERELALDCLQDTYARAYENLRRGKSVNQQWLYRVARNRAIDDFRRQRQVRTNVPEMEEIPMPEQGGNPRVRGVLAALSEE